MHHLSLSAGTYVLVRLVSILGGAVFLSIGQALVGLVKSPTASTPPDGCWSSASSCSRPWVRAGTLGATWESIARWSPVGVVMTLFAAVLNLSAWDTHDSLTLLACGGYIVVFASIGIRWFQWDAR